MRRRRSSVWWRRWAASRSSAGTTEGRPVFSRRSYSAREVRQARDRFLDGNAHRPGGCGVEAAAVAGEHPLEAVVAQAHERAQLIGPRVPADAAAHVEARVVFVPPQVIAGEEKPVAVEQRNGAAGVAGDGDDGELVVEGDRIAAGQTALDGQRARVGGVHDALAAEAAREGGVIGDVVAV